MLVLFIMNGLLYYLFPQYHYLSNGGATGWLPFVKYLCILLAIPLLVRMRFSARDGVWVSIGLAFLIAPMINNVYWIQTGNRLVWQYQLPILAFFFAPFLMRLAASKKYTMGILYLILIASVIATILEIVTGSLFLQYTRSGFRAVGPFINPNNTGIVVALAAIALHFLSKGFWLNFLLGALTIVVLVLTGSKTAIIIYLLGFLVSTRFIYQIIIAGSAMALSLFLNPSLFGFVANADMRSFSLESGILRLSGVERFFEIWGQLSIDQLLFGFSRTSLVDNTYLDLLSFGGLYLLTVFVLSQAMSILLCYAGRQHLLLTLHGLLILTMTTTNVMRLWPLAYIYWALVGVSFYKSSVSLKLKKQNSPNIIKRGQHVH